MRGTLFAILLIWGLRISVFAAEISYTNKTYAPLEEIPLHFSLPACYSKFKLRIVSDSKIQAYSKKTKTWVFLDLVNNSLFDLDTEVKLKVLQESLKPIKLNLYIQDSEKHTKPIETSFYLNVNDLDNAYIKSFNDAILK